MEPKLVDIFRRSGDANVGETLVRLARLAEAAHRHEVAQQMAASARDDLRPVVGGHPTPVAATLQTSARKCLGQARTEVGR